METLRWWTGCWPGGGSVSMGVRRADERTGNPGCNKNTHIIYTPIGLTAGQAPF